MPSPGYADVGELLRRLADAGVEFIVVGGQPAHVPGTERPGAGVIHLQFPDSQGATDLEPIGWDHFFEKFDEKGLALVYEEATSDGHVSRFNRIIESPRS
jgi:hypothetical protein